MKIPIIFMMILPTMTEAQISIADQKSLLNKQKFSAYALIEKTIFTDRFNQLKKSEDPQNNKREIIMEPWNLALRFGLEISALTAMGFWGYEKGEGGMRYALMIGVPVLSAAAWGIFAVENDPSRSGNTIIATNGYVRLALELGFFAFATWALHDMGFNNLAYSMGGLTVIHYAFSYKRILWLIAQ